MMAKKNRVLALLVMKAIRNTIIFTLLFTVLACNLAACKDQRHECYSEEFGYQVLVVNHSDSIPGVECTVEMQDWELEEYVDPAAEKAVIITVNGETVQGTYSHTDKDFPNNFPTRIYYGENNLQFGLDEDGKLQFYFWGTDGSEGETVRTEQECLTVAKEFLTDYADIDQYKLEVAQRRNLYDFTFTKYAGDYATLDHAIVTVHESGKLYSFSSFMLGKISLKNISKFDEEEALEFVEEKIDKIYSGVKKDGVTITYSNPEFMYASSEYLYCVVDVNYTSGEGGAKTVLKERLGLILVSYLIPKQ